MNPVIYNTTPYRQQGLLLADPGGQLVYAMVISATFGFDDAGEPVLAAVQPPVAVSDESYGAPGRSSIRRDSVAYPRKPGVDLIVEAAAYAPQGKPVQRLLAGVRLGDWTKVVSVCGDRRWSGPFRSRWSTPRPFVRMPIRYERAFGGTLRSAEGDVTDWHRENPVGVGYAGARSSDPEVDTEVPNIEQPDSRLAQGSSQCAVAGFGVVARHWWPRVGHAGTYDKTWLEQRSPVLPTDFDSRFHHCAPTDQQFASDLAGKLLLLRNLTPEGIWQCRIPSLSVELTLLTGAGEDRREVHVDTVFVDADAKTVTLIARHCIDHVRRLGPVPEIVLGRASRAWLRSRQHRKRYIGRSAPLPSV